MRHFCTYFDRNYFVKGLALIDSLITWHPSGVTIYVVCMDELTRVLLEKCAIPQVVLVPLHAIENGDEALLAARGDRTAVEYLWTSTPTIILRLLERHAAIDMITYVDADMFFYGPTEPIFEELSDGSVMIHEHRFPRVLAHLETFGRFNVGLMVFRRDRRGFEVLQWWRERCLEWCKATLEDNKYGDQKYLDVWPTQFEGVVVTRNEGVGTAPWNHAQYMFSERGDGVYANNSRLLINHFHAFHLLNGAVIVPVGIREYCNPLSYYATVLPPYLAALDNSISRVRHMHPDFSFGLQKEDFSLTPELSFLIRTTELPHFGDAVSSLPRYQVAREWTLFPGTRVLEDRRLESSASVGSC
jgi:hypothetical protein